MKALKSTLVAALALGVSAVAAQAGTLDDVKERGRLLCGVNTGLPGFAYTTADGEWAGFDAEFCQAVAAAVLGDPTAVEYVPLTAKTRFTALASGEIDVLSRNTTWTFSRDTDLGNSFAGVSYYDGQGFLIRKDLGITSASGLDGATVCIQSGTTTELNLAEFFRVNGISYEPVPVQDQTEAQKLYIANSCDVYTSDASGLAATRSSFADADAHMILPEIISKEPLGPVVRHGDDQWKDIVSWTLYALVAAEEFGVTAANADALAAGADTAPEVKRLLGAEGGLGEMLGVSPGFALEAIKAVGNYGEWFERNLGEATPIGLARGLNAQWSEGGLQYAPPFR